MSMMPTMGRDFRRLGATPRCDGDLKSGDRRMLSAQLRAAEVADQTHPAAIHEMGHDADLLDFGVGNLGDGFDRIEERKL